MTGWLVAAFLLGLVAGAGLMLWVILKRLPHLLQPVAAPVAPEPVPAPATVYEPPDPEKLVDAMINDGVKDRMRKEFMEKDGKSEADANRAIDDLLTRINTLGADVQW